MSLQWVPENKRALGFQGQTIVVTSQAVLDELSLAQKWYQNPP